MPPPISLPRANYIDHDDDLRALFRQLAHEPLIALDTESNSLYAYRERVCLIQLSTREQDYIIDPLRVADLTPLGTLMADPAVLKVFHAAEYDLICLKRDYGFQVVNLFDTMVAARVLGRKAVGLERLLGDYLDVKLDKSHQRDDWGQRPLPRDMLTYAQMDTHFLPLLYDRMWADLAEAGRTEEAGEIFEEVCAVEVSGYHYDPDGYWRIGIPADLSRREMAILKELYALRERLAEEKDWPPFKVFNDRTLVHIAEQAPTHIDALAAMKGVGPQQARRYGREVLEAIARGQQAPLPQPPQRPPEIEPMVAERFTALRDWRKARAEQRGVESDVILSRDTLWSVAQRGPNSLADLKGITGLGPWRLATYGEEILAIIRQTDTV